MNAQNYAQAWKFLKEQTSKVQDPILRNAMMAEFKKRAMNEWGFDPETSNLSQGTSDNLTPWQKEFADDIQDTVSYGIDVREEKRQKTLDETRKNMREYVRTGNSLADIPEDIRTPYIQRLYFEELFKIGDELCQAADDLIKGKK